MKKTILLLVALLFIYNNTYSQNKDSLYSLTAYIGAGYVYNVTSFDYEYASLNRGGWQGIFESYVASGLSFKRWN